MKEHVETVEEESLCIFICNNLSPCFNKTISVQFVLQLYTSMRCVAAVSVMFDLYFVLLFINSRAAAGYRHHLVLYHHSLLLD